MILLVQLVVNGLAAGAIYAFVSLGFALIYNATGILHLAHGGAFALGGYAFYVGLALMKLPIPVSAAMAVAAAAVFGIATERLVYRPLRARGGEHAVMMIASLGVLTFVQAAFGIVFGTDNLSVRTDPLATITVGGLYISYLHVIVAVLAIVIISGLQLYLVRSRHGRAIRAFADDPKLTRVLGINTERVNAMVFGIGSGLAAVAACLLSFDSGVRPDVGFSIMFTALVAVIIGGTGYLPGAAAGGLIVGLLQSLSLWSFTARWQDVTVFGVLVAFLLVRPQGVFGSAMLVRRA